MGVSRQAGQKDKLQKQLATAQGRLQTINLERLTEDHADLERQIEEATPQFHAVRERLAEPMGSTLAASAVYTAAAAYELIVGELTSSEPVEEQLEGVTMSAVTVRTTLYGSTSDIVGFIKNLSTLLKNGAIRSIDIVTAPRPLSSQVAWTSSNPDVAVIDNTGMAVSLGTGNTTITATSGGASANATLSVTALQPPSLSVSPASGSVLLGQTQQFTLVTGTPPAVVSGNNTVTGNSTARIEFTVYTYRGDQ
jgi:hypothetical protein